MKKIFAVLAIAFAALAILAGVTHAVGVGAIPKTATVSDSTTFMVRRPSPDSIPRGFQWGRMRDTINVRARVIVHDSMLVRVPQAIDTAATPRFHAIKIGGVFPSSICGDSTVYAGYILFLNVAGDSLYVPACSP